MSAILANLAWLHGGIWAGASQVGSSSTTPGDGGVVSGQFSRPGRQFHYIGGPGHGLCGYYANMSSLGLGGTNTGKLVARVYHAMAAVPASGDRTALLMFSAGTGFLSDGAVIRCRSDGKLEAGFLDKIDEVQRLSVAATAGTFTLTFTGQTTAAIAWNANAAAVQAALEALSNIDPGDVTVTGGPGGTSATPFFITFGGQYHGVNVTQMTSDSTLLTGSTHTATMTTTTTGSGPTGKAWNGALASGSQVSAETIAASEFVRVEGYVDVTGTTYTLKWQFERIDPVTGAGLGVHVQTDATLTGQVADTWQAVGMHEVGAVDGPVNVQDNYSTDLALSNDGATYPLGPGRSVPMFPNGMGTNVNPTQFTEEDGTAIDANSWQRIATSIVPFQDNVAEAAANDGLSLRMNTPMTSGNLLEFTFDDLTTTDIPVTATPVLVGMWLMHNSSVAGFPSVNANLDMYVSGTLLQAALTFTSNTNVRAFAWGTSGGFYRPSAGPGGAWTLSDLNAFTAKWRAAASGGTAGRYYGLHGLLADVHMTAATEADLHPPITYLDGVGGAAASGAGGGTDSVLRSVVKTGGGKSDGVAGGTESTLAAVGKTGGGKSAGVGGGTDIEQVVKAGGGIVTGRAGAPPIYEREGGATATGKAGGARASAFSVVLGRTGADEYDNGASDPFGSSVESHYDISASVLILDEWVRPNEEDDFYYSRLPFREAQQVLAVGTSLSGVTARLGWYGSTLDPDPGSFAIVRKGGPLEALLGERVKVTVRVGPTERSVYAYVHNMLAQVEPEVDLALSRVLFVRLAALATDYVLGQVEVMVG